MQTKLINAVSLALLLVFVRPLEPAYASNASFQNQATHLATQAALERGFKLADFSAPHVDHHHSRSKDVWEVIWTMKSTTRRYLKVWVDLTTNRTEVLPLSYFLYAWHPGEPKIELPSEVAPFVESGMTPIELESGDLNGDGLGDYLVVVSSESGAKRVILVLTRQTDGALRLEARNDRIAACQACGGTQADGFDGIDVGYRSFTVNNSSGDAGTPVHLHSNYRFDYSNRDSTWELVLVEEDGWRFSPPRDFGLIKFSEFDGNYLSK